MSDIITISKDELAKLEERIRNLTMQVAERNRTEDEFRSLAERLTLATRIASMGVWDWDLRTNMGTIDRKLYEIYGLTNEGTPIPYEMWTRTVYPEDLPKVLASLQKAISHKGYDAVEFRIVRPDGTLRYIQAAESVVVDDDQKVIRVVGVNYDITERKQVETALLESERKFRTLFDSANDSLFILDLEGNIKDVNRTACERLGYTKDELTSMHVSQLDISEFAGMIAPRMKQLIEDGHAIMESAHRKKDGTVMPVEINARVIDYEGKKVLFSAIRDVTARKQTEKERERLIMELKNTIAKVRSLSGLLPICASCKNIRDDKGYWKQIEAYISEHTEAEFSHGLCPDCAVKIYPDHYKKKSSR